jgi:hypothetical protein
MRDVWTFLESGEPLLPVDVIEFPAGISELMAKEERERREADKALRQAEAEADRRNREKKQAEERAALAEKTGIPVDQLEKLAIAPETGAS